MCMVLLYFCEEHICHIHHCPEYKSTFFCLQAYSLHDREVGYCQGSGFIVGLLLMQVGFWSSIWLFINHRISEGLKEQMKVPSLYIHWQYPSELQSNTVNDLSQRICQEQLFQYWKVYWSDYDGKKHEWFIIIFVSNSNRKTWGFVCRCPRRRRSLCL